MGRKWSLAGLLHWPMRFRDRKAKDRAQSRPESRPTGASVSAAQGHQAYVLPPVQVEDHQQAQGPDDRHTTPPLRLETFSPELLAEILEFLDHKSLINFASTCRRFRDVVRSSSAFLYRLELSETGLEDGAHSARVLSDRLSLLRARKAAWRDFEYRQRRTIMFGPGACRPCYDLHGGVFFVGRRADPASPLRALSWMELPSVETGGVEAQWQMVALDVDMDDFALDLQQDLVIIVEMLVMGADTIRIHLRSFATMGPHPLALKPILELDCNPVMQHSTIVVDICGRHMGLLYSWDQMSLNDSDKLIVWDWTTGEIVCTVHAYSSKLTSFTFLSEDVFLLPDVGRGTIDLYMKTNKAGTSNPTFTCAVSLALPETKPGCVLFSANSRYRSRGLFSPSRLPSSRPPTTPIDSLVSSSSTAFPNQTQRSFFLSQTGELVVISLKYKAGQSSGQYFTLIAPKTLFLSYAAQHFPPVYSTTPPPGLASPTVLWETWGSNGSRLIKEPIRLWDYFFSGTRYVTLAASGSVSGEAEEEPRMGSPRAERTGAGKGRKHVRVMEFNQAAVRRFESAHGGARAGVVEGGSSSSSSSSTAIGPPLPLAREDAVHRSPTRVVRVVREETVIPAGGLLFANEVRTALPYVETTTVCAFDVQNLMCDHERVICLKTNEHQDMVSLDVFML